MAKQLRVKENRQAPLFARPSEELFPRLTCVRRLGGNHFPLALETGPIAPRPPRLLSQTRWLAPCPRTRRACSQGKRLALACHSARRAPPFHALQGPVRGRPPVTARKATLPPLCPMSSFLSSSFLSCRFSVALTATEQTRNRSAVRLPPLECAL